MPDVLVIGAGCFGISTAYHILKRGYQNVTVIDRSDVLPAPDAASTDYNKGSYEIYCVNPLAYDFS